MDCESEVVDATSTDGCLIFQAKPKIIEKRPISLGVALALMLVAPINGMAQVASDAAGGALNFCLLYTSPSPRDQRGSRMPSSA